MSRFSRSGTLFALQKLKELDNLGIGWESYQEPYFRSVGQFRDVVISVMGTVAKIEREKISERTKAGLRRAKAEGKVMGRPKVKVDEARLLKLIQRHGSINRAAIEAGVGMARRIALSKKGGRKTRRKSSHFTGISMKQHPYPKAALFGYQ